MNEQANVSVVLSTYDAFRRGDIAFILKNLDPQVEWKVEGAAAVPYCGIQRGREAVAKNFFVPIGETLDEITLIMEPFAAQGDNVVTAGRYQARVKSTGKRVDVPLVHLWTIRNGLVARYQGLDNSAVVAAAYTSGAQAAT